MSNGDREMKTAIKSWDSRILKIQRGYEAEWCARDRTVTITFTISLMLSHGAIGVLEMFSLGAQPPV